MTLATLKSEFHNLIDKIEDPGILEQYYKALSTSIKPDNSLWASLTSEQQKGVLLAYEESDVEANLIPLSAIKAKYLK